MPRRPRESRREPDATDELVAFVIAVGDAHNPPVDLVEGPPQANGARTIWVAGYVGRPHQKVATVPAQGGTLYVYYNPAFCAAARDAADHARTPCALQAHKQLQVSGVPQRRNAAQTAALTAVVNASINANPHV